MYVRIIYHITKDIRTCVRNKQMEWMTLKKYQIKVETNNEVTEREKLTFETSNFYDVITMIRCDSGQNILLKTVSDSNVVFEEIIDKS